MFLLITLLFFLVDLSSSNRFNAYIALPIAQAKWSASLEDLIQNRSKEIKVFEREICAATRKDRDPMHAVCEEFGGRTNFELSTETFHVALQAFHVENITDFRLQELLSDLSRKLCFLYPYYLPISGIKQTNQSKFTMQGEAEFHPDLERVVAGSLNRHGFIHQRNASDWQSTLMLWHVPLRHEEPFMPIDAYVRFNGEINICSYNRERYFGECNPITGINFDCSP